MKKDISIIVVTCNSIEHFKLCLSFLGKYTSIPFKLIVVDNGSSDGTADFLRSNNFLSSFDAITVLNKQNMGIVTALHQAENIADSKYLVSLSDDVLVSRNWLEDLVSVYESFPRVKALGPIKPGSSLTYPYSNLSSREVWESIKGNNVGQSSEELLNLFCGSFSYDRFVQDFKKVNSEREVILECPPDFISGCCVLVETDYIRKVGGFVDTRFLFYGCEDVDRCWRIGDAGGQVMCTSSVFVHHFEGAGLGANSISWKRLLKENNRKLVEKWSPRFWDLLESYIKKGCYVEDIVERHWIIGWLLESLYEDQIPKRLRSKTLNFLKTWDYKLKDGRG